MRGRGSAVAAGLGVVAGFAGADFDPSGSTVRIKDGGEETYSVLGAWDTNPEKHIISYLSQMAQALIGHVVGDRVSVPTETGEHEVEVVHIEVAKR